MFAAVLWCHLSTLCYQCLKVLQGHPLQLRRYCNAVLCTSQLVYDETGRVWIMLHSGSRGIGNSTAQHYDRLAAELLKKQGIKVPSKLHYMEVDSEEGQAYLQVLQLTVNTYDCYSEACRS